MALVDKKILFKTVTLIAISMILFCGSSESSTPQKPKKETLYVVVCHEDNYVEQVEKTKDKIFASSTLKSGKYNYKVQNLFDGKKETCWCPEGDGIGEFIIVKIPYGIKGIRIINGLATTDELFKNNNRVKELYVGIITDLYYPQKGMEEYDQCGKRKHELHSLTNNDNNFILQDNKFQQDILFIIKDFKGIINFWKEESFKRSNALYLVIGINSIYKGSKYNDTCISEIEIIK